MPSTKRMMIFILNKTKNGEKRIYKLAKLRERKTRDVNYIKCIKGENFEKIKERRENYFEKLSNEIHRSIYIEDCRNHREVRENIFS